MKHTFALGFLVTVLVLGGAGVAKANHTWGNYHWARTISPFTLPLGDNVAGQWDSYLAQTSSDWSISTILDTRVVVGGTNNTKGKNTPKNCTPTSGRGEICNAKYGANGWLGIASVWASGDHITAGTVKLNDTYYTMSALSNTKMSGKPSLLMSETLSPIDDFEVCPIVDFIFYVKVPFFFLM